MQGGLLIFIVTFLKNTIKDAEKFIKDPEEKQKNNKEEKKKVQLIKKNNFKNYLSMSNKSLLDNIKKLRELTGVGFKDCKVALEENDGEIEKSIDYLRKKGIAKASKKMSRTASEGLALITEEKWRNCSH